jgi:hypothetical protein
MASLVTFALEVSWPWTDAILDGFKSVETREYELPEALARQPVLLIEVDNENQADAVVGVAVFDASVQYEGEDDWAEDSGSHLVSPDDSRFAWNHSKEKHGWRVSRVTRFSSRLSLPEMKREFRSIFRLNEALNVLAIEAGGSDGNNKVDASPQIEVISHLHKKGAHILEWRCDIYPQRIQEPFERNTQNDIAGFVTSGTARLIVGPEGAEQEKLIGKGGAFYIEVQDRCAIDVLAGIQCVLVHLPPGPKSRL